MRDESSLLQGTLDILVLRALVDGPQHGYGVARWIHEVTDGELTVGDRALYVALHRADERGWVSASWGKSENNRRARFYELTAAGRRALAEFGDLDAARRELGAIDARIAARGAWSRVGDRARRAGRVRFTALLDDGWLAWRRLRTHPGSALLVTVMLAMAIGLTAAMFTISDALIFRPVPFHDPNELVVVEMPAVEGPSNAVNLPLAVVDAWRESGPFKAVGGALPVAGILEGGAEPVRRGAWVVTPGLLDMFGTRPLLGRTFVEGEGRAGSEETVVLSERVWRAEFSSDPSILGRVVEISGRPMRVVGVMPAEFRFPNAFTDLWVPIDAGAPRDRHRELIGLVAYARLPAAIPRDDVLERARLVALDSDPDWADGRRVTTRPLARGLDEYSTQAMAAVSAGVVLVFLVLCFNSANLLLGRLASRRREFATASALGASRGRLLRQALLEHAALGIGASVLGTGVAAGLLAWAQVSLLPATALERVTLNAVDLDGRAVLATSLAGLVATVLAGVLPAWLATSPQAAMWLRTLVDRADTESRSARLFARALLVAQIAFAVVLLVGAGVLLRSFVNLMQRDLGVDAENVIVVDVSLPDHVEAFQDRSGNVALVRSLVEEVGSLAGVSAAALSVSSPPLGGGLWWSGEFFGEDGSDAISFDRISVYRVTQTFFDVYGIPIIEGRAFRAGDGDESVILGERLARILWPDGTAAGSRLRRGRQSFQVIGVAREIRTYEFPNPADDALEMYWFYEPNGLMVSVFGATISLRCSAVCPSAAAIRQRIHGVNPRLLVSDVERVSAAYAELLGQPRAAATLATSFAVIALLTFASGLFSALHYAVGRRLPELGIRAALGASAATLGRTVLREGLSVAVAGLACGGLAAWWLSSWLAAITYETPSPDAMTWIAVIGIVSAATLAGVWAPARRAMRADPLRLLRDQ